MPDSESALILHLQRLSTEDGPGIRTTIFFKGCPLHCSWCHNPESIPPYTQVQWIETRCIGCGTCLTVCPNESLSRLPEGAIQIDRELCQGCGTCAEACPANAMERLGQTVTIDDLTAELLKDKAYFDASGGGVTASGGEPTLQPGFVAALFQRLQAEGIHTALDTCGACTFSSLSAILPYTNLVLFDLKLMDSNRHRQETGQENKRILNNLLQLAKRINENQTKTRLWIRTPLIPGVTATEENLISISTFLHENLNGIVARWECCAFNNLCRDKYRRLGMTWKFNETPLMSHVDLAVCEQAAQSGPFNPSLVQITGAAQSTP